MNSANWRPLRLVTVVAGCAGIGGGRAAGADLTVTRIDPGPPSGTAEGAIELCVEWLHAWSDSRSHDGAWIVVLDLAKAAATNEDWPRGTGDGRAVDEIGDRGGAEYFAPKADLTNPFSIVAARTFAAWNGAYAAPTYSTRGVRTAE
jgi:hypothetical protein